MSALRDMDVLVTRIGDGRSEALLRGRLGDEIARLYGDTLSAPLPCRLSRLVEALQVEFEAAGYGEHKA